MFSNNKPLTDSDLAVIEARARAIVPLGYLVTALSGSLAPEKGEEQAYLIAELADKDTPALLTELRNLRAENVRLLSKLGAPDSAT